MRHISLHLQYSCNREFLERESSASASAQCAKDSERPVLTENAQRTVRSLKMHDAQRESSFKKKKKKEDARRQVLHVFLPARQSARHFFIFYLYMYSPDVRTATHSESKLFCEKEARRHVRHIALHLQYSCNRELLEKNARRPLRRTARRTATDRFSPRSLSVLYAA